MLNSRSILISSAAVTVCLFLLLAPVSANAQVTIHHVRVTVSHNLLPAHIAVYCDTGTLCAQPIWDAAHGFPLVGGVPLDPGETLVLTETGLLGTIGGNFDTSEAIKNTSPFVRFCSSTDPCNTKIELDTTGDGIVNFDYTYTGGADPIDNFNLDTPANSDTHDEFSPFLAPVLPLRPNFTLQLGYADNAHGCNILTQTCWPSPFNGLFGTTPATVFVGDKIDLTYDAGVLLITAFGNCTVTQGFWKTHGPDARGNNDNEWPVQSLKLGTRTYNADELQSIFDQPVKGNGLISLAHQLIAAKLNIANGASPNTIAATIAAADALIGGLVVPPVGSGFLDPSVTSALTDALTDFNEGTTGPGHCSS